MFTEGVTIQRPAQYFLSSLLNYVMIPITEWKPALQPILAPLSGISFASFAINEPSLYLKKSDHLSLITGFVSISYLTSQFLSVNWIVTFIGQTIGTVIATYYFVDGFGYKLEKIVFGMALTVISCCLNSFFLEMKDKKEFLDVIKTDLMQSDLQKILTVLPEGVLIFKRFRNPFIIYWNDHFEKLLNFLPRSKWRADDDLEQKSNPKQSSIMTQLKELNKSKKCPWNL